MSSTLLLGDSRELLAAMEPNSVDAIAMARIEHAASVAPETNRAEYVPPKKKQLGLF